MAVSDYKNGLRKQCELEQRLKEIAAQESKVRRAANRISFCMHTPKEAMRQLEEQARSRH